MFIGSFGDLWITPAPVFMEGLMTAIGINGTNEGIIIGADGRRSVDEKSKTAAPDKAKTEESEEAQKIFPLQGTDKNIAYALAGNIANPDTPFDAVDSCAKIAEEFRLRDFENETKFVNRFAAALRDVLRKAKHLPELSKTPNGDWNIMDLFFAGYFHKSPFVFYVNFYHSLSCVKFEPHRMPLAGLLYGSGVVLDKMYDKFGNVVPESPFSQFIQDPRQIKSLDESVKYVKGYIDACSTDLAREIDPKHCNKIGGHIHIAELTPSGFRWRIPPIKKQSAA